MVKDIAAENKQLVDECEKEDKERKVEVAPGVGLFIPVAFFVSWVILLKAKLAFC